jgi:uncharacterized protein YggU (UPF0235/DUF167 family)
MCRLASSGPRIDSTSVEADRVVAQLEIRVQPGARRNGFVGWYGPLPKLAVTARPVGGAANAAVVETLAAALGLRARQIHIVGGATSRTKRVEIDGLTVRELADAMARVNPDRPGRT